MHFRSAPLHHVCPVSCRESRERLAPDACPWINDMLAIVDSISEPGISRRQVTSMAPCNRVHTAARTDGATELGADRRAVVFRRPRHRALL